MSSLKYDIPDHIFKKFEKSVHLDGRKIYFADHTLRDFNGNVVGYWDEYWSLCKNGHHSPEYVDAYDFKSKDEFIKLLNKYLKLKGVCNEKSTIGN